MKLTHYPEFAAHRLLTVAFDRMTTRVPQRSCHGDSRLRGTHSAPLRHRGVRAARLAAFALGLVGPVYSQGGPSLPEIAGFRLGATWGTVARSLPCRREPIWAGVRGVTVCDASDTLRLGFIRDTLFDIVIEGSYQHVSPNGRWNSLRTGILGALGVPDSVLKSTSTDSTEWITARWRRRDTQDWNAWLQIGGRSPEPGRDPSSHWMVRVTHCRIAAPDCR